MTASVHGAFGVLVGKPCKRRIVGDFRLAVSRQKIFRAFTSMRWDVRLISMDSGVAVRCTVNRRAQVVKAVCAFPENCDRH
jgi:hypothetical protein